MTVPPRPQDAAPGVAASPKADESMDRTNGPRGASPEGNDGEPGAAVPPATKLADYEDYAKAFLIGETKRRMLALVEIAKAAEVIWPKLIDGSYGRNVQITKAEIDDLGAALARLNTQDETESEDGC